MCEPAIIVVSGLPRSGTSLMMQILEASGLELITDGQRTADQHNPLGYYEFEAVKSIARDTSFLEDAEGKAVKIIVQLIKFLPLHKKYKIIVMQRDLDEIMQSQKTMLGQAKQLPVKPIKNIFRQDMQKSVTWILEHDSMDLLLVDHRKLITDPETTIDTISRFLEIEMKQADCQCVIAPDLYRSKKSDDVS